MSDPAEKLNPFMADKNALIRELQIENARLRAKLKPFEVAEEEGKKKRAASTEIEIDGPFTFDCWADVGYENGQPYIYDFRVYLGLVDVTGSILQVDFDELQRRYLEIWKEDYGRQDF